MLIVECMLLPLHSFDPIAFLGVETNTFSPEETERLRAHLGNMMAEYVLFKLSDRITLEQLNVIVKESRGVKMLENLLRLNPTFATTIQEEFDRFKVDFESVLKHYGRTE